MRSKIISDVILGATPSKLIEIEVIAGPIIMKYLRLTLSAINPTIGFSMAGAFWIADNIPAIAYVIPSLSINSGIIGAKNAE